MKRGNFLGQIEVLFRTHSAVGILGPRQCGKTTLAREYIAALPQQQVHYFDLEDPEHLNRLAEPKLTLAALEGLIVIDEVQRSPELFPLLRVLIDQKRQSRGRIMKPQAAKRRCYDAVNRPALGGGYSCTPLI